MRSSTSLRTKADCSFGWQKWNQTTNYSTTTVFLYVFLIHWIVTQCALSAWFLGEKQEAGEIVKQLDEHLKAGCWCRSSRVRHSISQKTNRVCMIWALQVEFISSHTNHDWQNCLQIYIVELYGPWDKIMSRGRLPLCWILNPFSHQDPAWRHVFRRAHPKTCAYWCCMATPAMPPGKRSSVVPRKPFL